MKLEELYTKTMSDEALKKAYMDALSEEKLAEFLAANGCEATEEELRAFLDSKQNKTGELADDELDQVAGGAKCGTLYNDDGWPVITVLNSCEYYQNENTWKKDDGDGYCRSCRYSKDCDGILLCKCSMRKYN